MHVADLARPQLVSPLILPSILHICVLVAIGSVDNAN